MYSLRACKRAPRRGLARVHEDGMEVTWIAILASLCMGIGAVLIFVFAVKRNYFRNLEDTKYQVFWSDLEEELPLKQKEEKDDEEPRETHD